MTQNWNHEKTLREALEDIEGQARALMQSNGYQESLKNEGGDSAALWVGPRLHAILDTASAALNTPQR